MDKIIEYLRSKGFIVVMEHAISVAPKLFGEEFSDETMNKSVRGVIIELLDKDETLRDMVFEYALDATIKDIIKALDLHVDKNATPDKTDKLAAILSLINSL